MFLFLVQFCKTIQMRISKIQQIKNLSSIVVYYFLARFELQSGKIEFFLYNICNPEIFLGKFVRNGNLVLFPIHIFDETVGFDMLSIIRIIIDSSQGSQFIESFNQRSFMIEIGKTKWSMNSCHSFFLCPGGSYIKQRFSHFCIVNKIHPPKTGMFLIPGFVGYRIEDTCNSSGNFTLFKRHKISGFAKVQSRIFTLT